MLITGGFFITFKRQREQKHISSITTGSLFYGKHKNVLLHGFIKVKFTYSFF